MTASAQHRRPYHLQLVPDESADGRRGWVASVAELPGCVTQGDSPEAAVARLGDAMDAWLTTAAELGLPIPEPAPESPASGRLLLRLPRSLHERLAFEATQDGVSLNQLLVGILAGAVGWKVPATGNER